MNANGAMLACFGQARQNRTPFPKEIREGLSCYAQIGKDSWSIRLVLPVTLIKAIYPNAALRAGSTIKLFIPSYGKLNFLQVFLQ
jgi:hypothetical protein